MNMNAGKYFYTAQDGFKKGKLQRSKKMTAQILHSFFLSFSQFKNQNYRKMQNNEEMVFYYQNCSGLLEKKMF